MTLIQAAELPRGTDMDTDYDQYACRVCRGTGMRRNESANIADPRREVPCFCYGGRVFVLRGFTPPWYAGQKVEAQGAVAS